MPKLPVTRRQPRRTGQANLLLDRLRRRPPAGLQDRLDLPRLRPPLGRSTLQTAAVSRNEPTSCSCGGAAFQRSYQRPTLAFEGAASAAPKFHEIKNRAVIKTKSCQRTELSSSAKCKDLLFLRTPRISQPPKSRPAII